MADSKLINFEKSIKLTSCDDIFCNFLRKNNTLFSFDSVCTVHTFHQCLRGTTFTTDDNTAAVALSLNCDVLHVLPNFYVNFILSECTDSADSCDDMFM